MTRKTLLVRSSVIWFLLAILNYLHAGEPFAAKSPNFLVILCDDLGYSDLGCYGSEISTPQLDAIASSGLRFSQFYNTARCWPTRSALLTGYYAQQIRRDTVPGVKSGGQGVRPKWAKLLPERISAYGYRSYHSGKWHVDGLPTKNGFEKSYSLQDHDRHFQPKNHTLDDKPLPPAAPSDNYYSSNEIASRAIEQLKYHQENHREEPFFSFVAFTAPHFPLHAPKNLIDKYKPIYQQGWDQIRQQRWDKLKRLGLAQGVQRPSDVETEIGPPYHFPDAMEKLGPGELNRPLPWDKLTPEQRAFQADKMAVHAAMIEAMDIQIGRIFDFIKQDPIGWQNTLVLFLSDNGASAEIMVRGDGHRPDAPAGSAESYLCLGPGWSSVSNTPFRRHKTWVHEGGISTPMIAHWPAGIQPNTNPVSTPYHVIDIAPTILALASENSGTPKADWRDPALPGESFAREFNYPQIQTPKLSTRILWWQHEANRALRDGDWKIVASGKDSPWELYDLLQDRAETKNLAQDRPQELERLSKIWNDLTDQFRKQATADE